jgi:hypothetical protein
MLMSHDELSLDSNALCVEILTLMQAPLPPDVSCHAKNRVKTVPGARRVATFLPPLALEQDQEPGEASLLPLLSRHPNHNISPLQRHLSENWETAILSAC